MRKVVFDLGHRRLDVDPIGITDQLVVSSNLYYDTLPVTIQSIPLRQRCINRNTRMRTLGRWYEIPSGVSNTSGFTSPGASFLIPGTGSVD